MPGLRRDAHDISAFEGRLFHRLSKQCRSIFAFTGFLFSWGIHRPSLAAYRQLGFAALGRCSGCGVCSDFSAVLRVSQRGRIGLALKKDGQTKRFVCPSFFERFFLYFLNKRHHSILKKPYPWSGSLFSSLCFCQSDTLPSNTRPPRPAPVSTFGASSFLL